eukprot:c993_g1_i2.p1 GENE.c993_g1_i2~~c993_g1_i2.p1  ORF type:complete len:261 (+),score=29.69 c993_g1_i2:105-887(+)
MPRQRREAEHTTSYEAYSVFAWSCAGRCDYRDARFWPREALIELVGTAIFTALVALKSIGDSKPAVTAGGVLMGLYFIGFEGNPVAGTGHFNPAISFAMALTGQISFLQLFTFLPIQIIGAWAGALLAWLFSGEAGRGTLDLGRPLVAKRIGAGNVVGLEIVASLAVFLVFYSLFRTAALLRPRARALKPFAFGLAYTAICAATTSSRSVLNPAVALGQAFVSGETADLWIFVVMPFIGMGLAALLAYPVLREIGSRNDR